MNRQTNMTKRTTPMNPASSGLPCELSLLLLLLLVLAIVSAREVQIPEEKQEEKAPTALWVEETQIPSHSPRE